MVLEGRAQDSSRNGFRFRTLGSVQPTISIVMSSIEQQYLVLFYIIVHYYCPLISDSKLEPFKQATAVSSVMPLSPDGGNTSLIVR